ncbi:acyl-CoA N-acyltransferase [Pyronema domesticum]|uniref:Histone acetyltransferase ESA1 n=1 Tax=Pyronema omphalodes (strain CBS 100304) TaxID=1076935 RepID=U4LIW9_PYROM|nr:acyl-CoA N-acyltransferase [Pyronema domesticum]CCX32049.1 Similar to Histone acetyltransferase esa1; acc. no. C8VBH4 [Pyronema omphalodes CBS 100304]
MTSAPSHTAPSTPAAPSAPPENVSGEKSMATLSQLRMGVKLFVFHNNSGEHRLAEILSIDIRKDSPRYYVHYNEFNKRLDEWVTADKLDLSREVEWPRPDKPTKKTEKKGKASKAEPAKDGRPQKRPKVSRESVGPVTPKAPGPRQRRGTIGTDDGLVIQSEDIGEGSPEDMDIDDDEAVAEETPAGRTKTAKADGEFRQPEGFSKENEIEKLRTSGSMTQSAHEISRVRNLSRIQMGKFELEPWYFSPYPVEYTQADMVYICEFCLSYFDSPRRFERHRGKCNLMHPPGNEIYRDQNVSFFEIDGRRQRTWCRNLCLLSKCFLDHKTLYYDVDPFLFYCMAVRDESGYHLIGYFSKEKESAENYNVACILTLPQYQRHGYGKLLIAFSYELTKREAKLGSPEKPLSDLGLLSYRAYWQDTIVDILLDWKGGDLTIDELSNCSAMTTQDIIHTLQNLNMLKYYKGQHVIVLTDAILAQKERQRERQRAKGGFRTLNPENLIWKPPVFSAASRTWNW